MGGCHALSWWITVRRRLGRECRGPRTLAEGPGKGDRGVAFTVYAMAVLTALFFLGVGPLAALATGSGLL